MKTPFLNQWKSMGFRKLITKTYEMNESAKKRGCVSLRGAEWGEWHGSTVCANNGWSSVIADHLDVLVGKNRCRFLIMTEHNV